MSCHLIAGRFEVVKEVDTMWIRDLKSDAPAFHCSVDEVEAALQRLAGRYSCR